MLLNSYTQFWDSDRNWGCFASHQWVPIFFKLTDWPKALRWKEGDWLEGRLGLGSAAHLILLHNAIHNCVDFLLPHNRNLLIILFVSSLSPPPNLSLLFFKSSHHPELLLFFCSSTPCPSPLARLCFGGMLQARGHVSGHHGRLLGAVMGGRDRQPTTAATNPLCWWCYLHVISPGTLCKLHREAEN